MSYPRTTPPPELSAVVVHWRAEEQLARLLAAWPADPRFELLIVDNGSRALPATAGARWVCPPRNLGFAGAANLGVSMTAAPVLLLLNPDIEPLPGSLEELLAGLAALPDAAVLAPRLVGSDGADQAPWQLRPIPTALQLLLHPLFVAPGGDAAPPAEGDRVAQPAAACLAVRRTAWEAVGGLDPGFYPAWFEDVDLARRLRDRGLEARYWPRAVFRHGLGGSLESLGYGRFLWIYHRNLRRYLVKHHRGAAPWLRLLVPLGMLARLAALPLRRPRRASSRRAAAGGLLATALGGASAFRLPRRWARELAP